MRKNSLKSILFTICLVFALSCEKSNVADVEEIQSSQNVDPFAVPIDVADEVASAFSISNDTLSKDAKNLRKSGERKTQKSIETIVDEDNNPLFHIINFEEGGFVVVSADYRSMPVIAFSRDGELNYKTNQGVNGLSLWFEGAKEEIKHIKGNIKYVDNILENAWAEYISEGFTIPINKKGRVGNQNCQEWYTVGQFMCQNSFLSVGPIINVTWGQQGMTNYYAPFSPWESCRCDKAPAGCGPIAIGQVARFLLANNTSPFNYSIMPSFHDSQCDINDLGEAEVSSMLFGVGIVTNSDYNFLGSCNTLTLPRNLHNGITYAGLNGSGIQLNNNGNMNLIRTELNNGYPLIYYGNDALNQWHIWVCEGYKTSYYSSYNCDTHSCDEWQFNQQYMNWGWGGNSNGWFAFNQYNPSSTRNYSNNLHYFSNIRL